MSIWGSLIGGMIGFSFGGPFGALLGSFLGGKVSIGGKSRNSSSIEQNQQIFALSLIVLSAKLSKADGIVTKEELIAVKDKLKIPDKDINEVSKIFNKAKDESTGYEPYAKQIAERESTTPASTNGCMVSNTRVHSGAAALMRTLVPSCTCAMGQPLGHR